MCGIYGFIGKPTKTTRKIIKGLAILNEERGKDSAGVSIFYNKNFYLFKKAVNSSTFWNEKNLVKYIGIGKHSQKTIIIGHTRLATTGEVNDKNAHPFRVANIISAHNGIISNFFELQTKYKTNYKVDSQIITFLLATKGVDKTIKQIEGSYAVAYVNINDMGTLHLIRHSNPLAFGVTQNGLYFSSDIDHLKTVKKSYLHSMNVCKSGDNKIYSITFGDKIRIAKRKFVPKVSTYYSYSYNTDDWEEYDYYGRQIPIIREYKKEKKQEEKEDSKLVRLSDVEKKQTFSGHYFGNMLGRFGFYK